VTGFAERLRFQAIQRVLDKTNDEWRSLILFGLYTGQRPGDLARFTFQNVDLDRDEIRFVTRKTGRTMIRRDVICTFCGMVMLRR
jgi:integrase